MFWISDPGNQKPRRRYQGSSDFSSSQPYTGAQPPEGIPSKDRSTRKSDEGPDVPLSFLFKGEATDSRQDGSKTHWSRSSEGSAFQEKGSETAKTKAEKPPGVFFLMFGVFLPVAAVMFETTFHLCAQSFFDPFPSTAHVLLFLLIPVSNWLIWLGARKDLSNILGFLALGSGMAMGIGILYSLMFLPLVPLSILAVLWLGIGLLGLSPLLALPCMHKAGSSVCGLVTKHKLHFDGHLVKHIGHLIILVTVVAVELPSTLTRMHIGEAVSGGPKSQQAVDWLRMFGNQEVMLRACYERSGRATDIVGSLYESTHPIGIEQARELFYRVTGKPFNSVPLPAQARATIQHAGLISDPEGLNANVEDEFDLDPDIAGEAVSGVARGLSESESIFQGALNPDLLVADLTWTMTFTNSSKYDRESRAKVLLPPGAVVKKATLITNNQERDAIIMTKSLARTRYKAAVADRKDPLLVSMVGQDRVLVQCYPVAPESHVKVRLSIVAPMQLNGASKASLLLPTFEERNFQVDVPSKVELTSPREISKGELNLNISRQGSNCTAKGEIGTPELARFKAIIQCDRDPSVKSAYIYGRTGAAVLKVGERIYPRPLSLTLLIDGSNSMSQYLPAVEESLMSLPQGMPVKLVYVRDGLMESGNITAGSAELKKAIENIKSRPCAGGQNNAQSLYEAVSATRDGSAVLWIHGTQPIPASHFSKRLARHIYRSLEPLVYDVEIAAGPDEVLSSVNACRGLVRLERTGSLKSDLEKLFRSWNGARAKAMSSTTLSLNEQMQPTAENKPGTTSLAELATYNRILSLVAEGEATRRRGYTSRQAMPLASAYGLVTPVSSAIVADPDPQETMKKLEKARELSLHKSFSFNMPQLPTMDSRDSLKQLNALSAAAPVGQSYYASAGGAGSGIPASRFEMKPQQRQEQESYRSDSFSGATNGTIEAGQYAAKTEVPARSAQDKSFAEPAESQVPFGKDYPASPSVSLSQVESKEKSALMNETGNKSDRRYNARMRASAGERASEEFDDEESYEGSLDGAEGDSVNVSSAGKFNKNPLGALMAPMVPESDTYLLIGVGFALLAVAVFTRKKFAQGRA